jgi:hypothetical protein
MHDEYISRFPQVRLDVVDLDVLDSKQGMAAHAPQSVSRRPGDSPLFFLGASVQGKEKLAATHSQTAELASS